MRGKLKSIIKFFAVFIVVIFSLFLLAHFSMKWGVHVNFEAQFKSYWAIWLVIRLSIYTVAALFLYKLSQLNPQAYKKLIRACIIGAVLLEIVNIMQLV